jgi:hypothetical protein
MRNLPAAERAAALFAKQGVIALHGLPWKGVPERIQGRSAILRACRRVYPWLERAPKVRVRIVIEVSSETIATCLGLSSDGSALLIRVVASRGLITLLRIVAEHKHVPQQATARLIKS